MEIAADNIVSPSDRPIGSAKLEETGCVARPKNIDRSFQPPNGVFGGCGNNYYSLGTLL